MLRTKSFEIWRQYLGHVFTDCSRATAAAAAIDPSSASLRFVHRDDMAVRRLWSYLDPGGGCKNDDERDLRRWCCGHAGSSSPLRRASSDAGRSSGGDVKERTLSQTRNAAEASEITSIGTDQLSPAVEFFFQIPDPTTLNRQAMIAA